MLTEPRIGDIQVSSRLVLETHTRECRAIRYSHGMPLYDYDYGAVHRRALDEHAWSEPVNRKDEQ